ncbi:MAG: hypothetical protein RSF82_13095 [Angelakisella sp.]
MLKKVNDILNIVMGSFVGVTIGHSIYKYLNYRKYPDLYAMQSAPWYSSILLYFGFTVVVLLICSIVKIIIKQKTSNK